MTSVIGFIEPQGSVTQIFFSAIIGLAFWLLSSAFAPFESIRTDCLNFVSQMSTVLTLLLTVALQAGMRASYTVHALTTAFVHSAHTGRCALCVVAQVRIRRHF